MKKIVLLLMVGLLAQSCGKQKPYYQEPINNWLTNHLHNPETYEPVTFKVVNSSDKLMDYFPGLQTTYSNFENVVQRKLDLIPGLLRQNKSTLNKSVKDKIISLRREIMNVDTLGIANIEVMLNLNKKLDSLMLEQIDSGNMSNDKLVAQYEGTLNRFSIEKRKLSESLKKIDSSISEINKQLDKGLFVYHKFRASNKVGAIVLNDRLFLLNKAKENILESFDITGI